MLFDKYILIGADELAHRIYNQLSKTNKELVTVVDVTSEAKRKIKEFNGIKVSNLKEYKESHDISDVALVVTVNDWFINRILNEYEINERQLFVLNPYVSLRTFMRFGEYLTDERIPFSDERYTKVRQLFKDELSCMIFNELISAIPWDSPGDEYDIRWYPDVKHLFYMKEDYWDSYIFKGADNQTATVLDCGAYTGDCILKICENIPQKVKKYYAIEPSHANAEHIRKNDEIREKCTCLEVIECGVGDTNSIEYFKVEQDKTDGGMFISDQLEATDKIEMRRLEDMNLDIEGRLYLKMDVEGAELSALRGAANIIKKYRPYCAVCVYHRKNDLVDIPLYLKSLVSNYRFYLRGGYHTILWAIPMEME